MYFLCLPPALSLWFDLFVNYILFIITKYANCSIPILELIMLVYIFKIMLLINSPREIYFRSSNYKYFKFKYYRHSRIVTLWFELYPLIIFSNCVTFLLK